MLNLNWMDSSSVKLAMLITYDQLFQQSDMFLKINILKYKMLIRRSLFVLLVFPFKNIACMMKFTSNNLKVHNLVGLLQLQFLKPKG